MKERSREMGSSPPTAEEIFRDYSARRTDAVRPLTNDLELALIQFANDISSEAHVKVMRKVRVSIYEYQLESMFVHHMRRIIVQLYMDLLLLDCAALKFWIGAISEDAPLCCVRDFLDSKTSCDLLQERFRKENTSKYRRLCLTLAYLKLRNHRHQQLWLHSSSSSSIPPKFNSLSFFSPTQCVSILPGWCSLGTWCGEIAAYYGFTSTT